MKVNLSLPEIPHPPDDEAILSKIFRDCRATRAGDRNDNRTFIFVICQQWLPAFPKGMEKQFQLSD